MYEILQSWGRELFQKLAVKNYNSMLSFFDFQLFINKISQERNWSVEKIPARANLILALKMGINNQMHPKEVDQVKTKGLNLHGTQSTDVEL